MQGKEHTAGRFGRWLGSTVLRVAGWRVADPFPAEKKMVVIAAPHTSNWDFILGMAAKFELGITANWLGKHTIFFWPLGWLLRYLGGIPIDREAAHGTVEQAAELFQQRESMILALSPEGTRKRVEKWKTGFYHIALRAGVPILPTRIDYATRTIGVGPLLMPTGDIRKDLEVLGSYLGKARGKYPDQFALPVWE